jgi:ketosteroid isomerase-like protein
MRFIIALSLLFYSCSNHQDEEQNAQEAIYEVMSEQQKAWNNGNLEGYMNGYWKNDSLVFVGSSDINMGWNKTLKNYRSNYGEKSTMGHLLLQNISFKQLDGQHAWLMGKWQLYRTNDTLKGHYTLLWQLIDGQWKIVADHSS